MKQIKKVLLKEATRLSLEEMKFVFGGSGSEMTRCDTSCEGNRKPVEIIDCHGTCIAKPGSGVTCSGATKIMTKFCNGTSSTTQIV
ncbi:rSAM-modified peptide [Pseudoprevotella muciniphila]|uniref:RSAM-modified peptide n=1 Tax=Pseudoprevotella muciniphila TaxID=2133944 RepID=A0A5P8E8N3_9BACT|nr:TIGR04149 family rSAM-modified RiPP [Pseudoprevotella muciniphila]QFQ13304.1 rSAM-modified peptide [Pseudoprevotella muciniphila]